MKALLWPRRGEWLLPSVSGVLLALSFPPLHTLVLPFLGLVPFAVWVHGLSPDQEGRRAAVRGSLVFGSIYFGIVFYWILIALVWFTWLAIPAFVGSMMMLVGLAVLVGWTLHRMVHSVRVPLWIALPIAWTAGEWFRAHWPSSLSFPWLGLGTSLTGFPELVGIAEIVGARGVTFWIVLVNGLAASLVLDIRAKRGWARPSAILAAVVLMPMTWGVWRAGTLRVREVARVAVVQPNIPEHIKLDRDAVFDSTFASLDRLLPAIEPGSVDLVAFPEMTLPIFPQAADSFGHVIRVQDFSRRLDAPIVMGAYGFVPRAGGESIVLNSAFLMEPDGLSDYEYGKRYLVPFVERIPLLPSKWLNRLQYFGGFGLGIGWPLVETQRASYGVVICYESTYPEGARTYRLEGADVLLNITNDAWYGREALYSRTTALWQHPAHLVMRAIENRMGVARSANTGISLFVDPIGHVYGATALFEADLRTETVLTTDELTIYTRFGDITGNAAAFSAVLLLVVSWHLGRLDPSARRV